MMHYKRCLIPINLPDIPAVETWLADLAEKGLFLVSSGNYFAKFVTAEPAKVTYRLEATANPLFRADPDYKKILFFQEFGWEYICTFGNYFHVYRSELENPPEIHTDPKEQAQAFARICLAQAFVAMLLFGMLFYILHSGILSLANIVKLGFPMLFALLFLISLPIAYAAQSFRLYRIYRRLKNGILLEHSSDYRNRLPLRYLQRIVPAAAFVIILASVYGLTIINNESEQLEIPESFPMVSLAEIEQEDSLRLAPSGDYGNCILHNQTFFAPEQYTVRQAASVNGRQWTDDPDRTYSPSLTLELYRLRFPSLAGPTLHSLKRYSTRYGIWETETLEVLGAEEAYLCTSAENPKQQQVFLRTGDTIICLDYRGESEIRPFLPEFIVLAQADFPAIEP